MRLPVIIAIHLSSFIPLAVKCMRLPEIKNGQYRPPNYALTYHNQVYILCNHGYKYTGPFSSRTCQKNNEWSGIDGECVSKY